MRGSFERCYQRRAGLCNLRSRLASQQELVWLFEYMTDIGQWGGDYEAVVTPETDLDYLMSLIKQCYIDVTCVGEEVMFESSSIVHYRFVQRNRNKTSEESFLNEYIYCFLVKNKYGCSKYVVKIKDYDNSLLTIDFYKKIKSNNRYRLLSNDFKFGHVGATNNKVEILLKKV